MARRRKPYSGMTHRQLSKQVYELNDDYTKQATATCQLRIKPLRKALKAYGKACPRKAYAPKNRTKECIVLKRRVIHYLRTADKCLFEVDYR